MVFGDVVRFMADVSGVQLDDVRRESSFVQTTEDLDLGSWLNLWRNFTH